MTNTLSFELAELALHGKVDKDDPQDHRGERPGHQRNDKGQKDPSPTHGTCQEAHDKKRTITARIIQ